MKDPHLPEPTCGALDRTAELLAKLLSGSEDPDVTALSEAVKAKLGITEPLPQPALASPSPGLSTLAEDLKRLRVCRLLPKVTCPSPFHPCARTVLIAELQDVHVTETEKRGPSAPAPLAGVRPTPSGLTEKFIVFSALCFASPAACCWCRDSCCLFLEMKSFGFDEIQSLQVTPG